MTLPLTVPKDPVVSMPGTAPFSDRDALTGLLGPNLLRELAEGRFSEARRHGYFASLILARIDGLDALTSEYGPAIADDAVLSFSHLVRVCVRREDVLARIDEDRFVVLMMHCDAENATAKAEALRIAFQGLEPSGVKGSASFGVAATSVRPGIGFDDLMGLAAQALDHAVQSGGDRVEIAREDSAGKRAAALAIN